VGNPSQLLQSVTCQLESLSVTCHSTQVNAPRNRINLCQIDWHSVFLPQRDGRLNWPCFWLYILRWFTCLQTVIHPSSNHFQTATRTGVEPMTLWCLSPYQYIDCCVGLLAGSPKKTTAKLQRVLNAAARVVSNCGKYNRGLTHFWCHVLHWLDVTARIRFRLCIQVYKCQHSMAPWYLIDLCQPVASIDGREHLQSANRGQLQVPRIKMTTYGKCAFRHAN